MPMSTAVSNCISIVRVGFVSGEFMIDEPVSRKFVIKGYCSFFQMFSE